MSQSGFNAEVALALLEARGVKPEAVMDEFIRRLESKYRRAMRRQEVAAKHGGTRRRMRGKSLDGEILFQVDPVFYHYWGQRLGYACWKDKGFVHEFLRDNPACRVKTEKDVHTIVAGVDMKAGAQSSGLVSAYGAPLLSPPAAVSPRAAPGEIVMP